MKGVYTIPEPARLKLEQALSALMGDAKVRLSMVHFNHLGVVWKVAIVDLGIVVYGNPTVGNSPIEVGYRAYMEMKRLYEDDKKKGLI